MQRQRIYSGAPWESTAGYARAVRAGDHVFVAGTTSVDDAGQVFAPDDAYAQSCRIFAIIEAALQEAGANLADVVRTRIFVTHIARHADAVGRAHREAFGVHRPAATMVEVPRLIDSKLVVEIEAHAVVSPAK